MFLVCEAVGGYGEDQEEREEPPVRSCKYALRVELEVVVLLQLVLSGNSAGLEESYVTQNEQNNEHAKRAEEVGELNATAQRHNSSPSPSFHTYSDHEFPPHLNHNQPDLPELLMLINRFLQACILLHHLAIAMY